MTGLVLGRGMRTPFRAGLTWAPLYMRVRRIWRDSGRSAAGPNFTFCPSSMTSVTPAARARLRNRATATSASTGSGSGP